MEKFSMKPQPKEEVPGSPKERLTHAESDLKLARLAKDSKDILPEQICFHAQQAAEEALKATLLSNKIDFPLTHDIEELIELAGQNGLVLPQEVIDAGGLTPYAVEARYPGHLEEIVPSDVEEAIGIAEAVLRWAAGIVAA